MRTDGRGERPMNGGPVGPPRALARIATCAPPIAASMTVALVAVLPSWRHADGYLVILVGVLVGLPHGAVDHLLPPRWASRGLLTLHLVGYIAAMAVMVALILWSPVVGLAVFLAASLAHLGAGDVAFYAWRDGTGFRRNARSALEVMAFGGLPAVVTLWWWPERAQRFLDPVVPGSAAFLHGGALQVAAWLVLFAAVVTAAHDLRARGGDRALALGCLALLVLTVPPLTAFGVYFATWHSLRHWCRSLSDLPGNADLVAQDRLGLASAHFLRLAAPATLGAYAMLAAIAFVVGSDGNGGIVAPLAALIAALTVPHALTVLRFDRATVLTRPLQRS